MWWRRSDLLQAYIVDFVDDHLKRHAPGNGAGDADAIDLALSDPASSGLDSLLFLDLASRFSRCLGLDRSGVSDLLLARRSLDGWQQVACHGLERDASRYGFHSSGSTGDPALQVHATANVQRETAAFAAMLPDVARTVSLVPGHHIYGFLWTIVLTHHLDTPFTRLQADRQLPATLGAALRDDDLVVATPDIWSLLLRHDAPLPERFTAVSSTAPLAAETAALLRNRYPLARLLEIYGSTETAAIGWRDDHTAGWTLLPWWALGGEAGHWCLTDRDSGIRYPLNDRLEILADGRFQVRGRQDNVVQLGGHNVSLDRVRSLLESHPDVVAAAVRSAGDDTDRHLKFYLQLQAEPADRPRWCRQFDGWLTTASGNLPPPRTIVMGDRLPAGILGKNADWRPGDFPAVTGRYRHAYGPGTGDPVPAESASGKALDSPAQFQ